MNGTLHTDTYRTQGLRKKLVESLREKGISDERVLRAMMAIPRHYFLDPALDQIAYEDRAFPIEEGQTISQPFTVAYQTELLELRSGDKVLEIGTGSAYQATILAQMGAEVHTIERQRNLYRKVKESYPFQGKFSRLHFYFGDGYKGLEGVAPFQKIIVTAAAPYVPANLLLQLDAGGMLVIPVNEGDAQRMMRFIKKEDGTIREETFDVFRFVPMLKGRKK